MDNEEAALYLFCFARSGVVSALQATGVDGHSAIAILQQSPDLCAVVGEVAREDFCGPAAERHMQQLEWVAPRALRHEAVIEGVMASSSVLPVPFGTLFFVARSADRVRGATSRDDFCVSTAGGGPRGGVGEGPV